MATKTLILVRHGQYHPADNKKAERLTALGRKQAKFAARRLKEYKIDRIIHSSMPRAIETASIIKRQLGYRGKSSSCDSLRECVPGFPEELRKKFGFTDLKKLAKDKAQLDRAYKKYFKTSAKNSVDVLVCHGNVIRYLVCQVLGTAPHAWRRMDIQQCGISIVELRTKGHHRKILLSHNDVGHIPKQHRTFL